MSTVEKRSFGQFYKKKIQKRTFEQFYKNNIFGQFNGHPPWQSKWVRDAPAYYNIHPPTPSVTPNIIFNIHKQFIGWVSEMQSTTFILWTENSYIGEATVYLVFDFMQIGSFQIFFTVCPELLTNTFMQFFSQSLKKKRTTDISIRISDSTLPDTRFNRIVIHRIYRIVTSLNIRVTERNVSTIVSVVYNWNLKKKHECVSTDLNKTGTSLVVYKRRRGPSD